LTVLAVWVFACSARTHLPTQKLVVDGHAVVAEVADDPEERSTGLMYRTSLPADSGMLFVYPDAAPRSFWMKNTTLPLSIAFVSADGRILNIAHMKPLDRSSTLSTEDAVYALEMMQGWFDEHRVMAGASITGLPAPSAR
jgi:uncharacterized membrane protein (UPF0127 family)